MFSTFAFGNVDYLITVFVYVISFMLTFKKWLSDTRYNGVITTTLVRMVSVSISTVIMLIPYLNIIVLALTLIPIAFSVKYNKLAEEYRLQKKISFFAALGLTLKQMNFIVQV